MMSKDLLGLSDFIAGPERAVLPTLYMQKVFCQHDVWMARKCSVFSQCALQLLAAARRGTTSSSQVLKCRLLFCFAEASQPGYHGAGCGAAGRAVVDFGTDAVFQHPGLTKTSGHVPSSVCCLL